MNAMKAFAFAVLLVCLPLSAHANSATFINKGGTLGANGLGGLNLSGSSLFSVSGLGPTFDDASPNGSMILKTGGITGGSLASGATFGAGTFKITDANTGLLFQGTFSNITWTPVSGLPAGEFGWTLTGTITGTIGSLGVTGATVQLTTISTKGNPFLPGGKMRIQLSGGTTTIPSPTPELGTLSLLGTGLLGIAIIGRRKISGRKKS